MLPSMISTARISLGWCTPRRTRSGMRWRSCGPRMRSTMHCSETLVASSSPWRQGDPVQHQVERRGAAGAGEAVAVDLVEVGGDRDLGEGLDEARQVLPVDRAAVARRAGRRGPARARRCTRRRSGRRAGPSGAARRTPPCSGSAPSPGRRTGRPPAARRRRAARCRRDGGRRPGSRCRCWPAPARRRATPAASRRARRPDRRLAIRSGSIALVKAIIEKSGISRNRIGLGGGAGRRGGRSLMGWSGQRASSDTCEIATLSPLAQRHRQSQQLHAIGRADGRSRDRRVAWAQVAARGTARTPRPSGRLARPARARAKGWHAALLDLLPGPQRAHRPRQLAGGLAQPGAQARLRRGHRRRRRPRPRDRLLPRQGARHHQRRRARARLARRRQYRPQHHDLPLELPLRRERRLLRPRAQALGRAEPGAELQRHVQPARRDDAGAHRPRRAGRPAPHPRQPAQRRRQ